MTDDLPGLTNENPETHKTMDRRREKRIALDPVDLISAEFNNELPRSRAARYQNEFLSY